MLLTLPSVLAIDATIRKNPLQQIGEGALQRKGTLATFSRDSLQGFLFLSSANEELLIVPSKPRRLPDGHTRILQSPLNLDVSPADVSMGTWLRHPLRDNNPGDIDYIGEIQQVLASWLDAFSYVQEDASRQVVGLRGPQIGAVHAIHMHWSTTDSTATIVMPTGTGKTETMLSALISARCSKLLVVVPTDALRSQLARKFVTLGILKNPRCMVLQPGTKYPIVCTLHHLLGNVGEVDEVFGAAQVIVTTSAIAGQCKRAVQERMAQHCPYLFVDEAHHAEAPTWSAFKDIFKERRILQFTATPFREDGKPLDGTIIYKYPLRKAQQEEYFRPIHFEPVVQFNRKKADKAIAATAVAQLRVDAGKGHILMARVENVSRAEEVFALYNQYPEFNPVQLHTGIKSARQREAIRQQIITGHSKIVVCVDMLGEGFDLPELKIAAFHDIRKTLAVTLQLAGRFTRSRPDLGNATFIANTADVNVRDELRKLYTRDPDWNILLPELSERVIDEQVSLQEFLKGFTRFADEIPLRTVQPATSTVVYRTHCDRWTPENFRDGLTALNTCEQIHEAINEGEHTLIVVTARRVPLKWSDVESLFSWEWELYVIVWSPDQHLLFVNSSSNAGDYKSLAQAIAGSDASLIKGNDVFRSFAGINRLRLQNVGLTEQLGRNVRYTGRMGADVESVLSEAQRSHTQRSVLSGTGYEEGAKTSVGASRKGRIWSHRRGHVNELVTWCKSIGAKLLDTTSDPDEVLKGTLQAQTVSVRPAKMPISVDWPEDIYTTPEGLWSILLGENEYSISELSLDIFSPDRYGSLRFSLSSDTEQVDLEMILFESKEGPNCRFEVLSPTRVMVRRGARAGGQSIADFFYDAPPVIWFADGSSLEGNQYVELKNAYPLYDAAKIQAWNWTGVDIRKESQGTEKHFDSIQARVIRDLKTRNYQVIFDDDSKGEAADVVAIRVEGDVTAPSRISVEFYHCKYSQTDTPGQRVKDLYEVCGQAQKSIYWMVSPEKRTDLFSHLMRREEYRQERDAASRFEIGDTDLLLTIREISFLCPISLTVYIVQPGVSRANATRDQLMLISVTENYLMETYQIPFGVIASS